MTTIASYSWSTRREGNDGFVLETKTTDGVVDYRKEFGPMPPHIVPAFAHARRLYVASFNANQGNDYILEQ